MRTQQVRSLGQRSGLERPALALGHQCHKPVPVKHTDLRQFGCRVDNAGQPVALKDGDQLAVDVLHDDLDLVLWHPVVAQGLAGILDISRCTRVAVTRANNQLLGGNATQINNRAILTVGIGHVCATTH